MTRKDLLQMTRDQLLEMARRKGIIVPKGAAKAELVSALLKDPKSSAPPKRAGAAKSASPSARAKTASGRKTPGAAAHRKKEPARKKHKATLATARATSRKSGAGSAREKVVLTALPRVEEDQAAKFILGGSQIHDESRLESGPELPAGYGDHCLVALPRDPYWVYLYWELQEDRIQSALAGKNVDHHSAPWRLRVQVLDPESLQLQDSYLAGVDTRTGCWYLQLGLPGHSFHVELGVLDAAGEFLPVAASDRFRLPPDQPSARIDESWLGTDEETAHHYGSRGIYSSRQKYGDAPSSRERTPGAGPYSNPSSHNRAR